MLNRPVMINRNCTKAYNCFFSVSIIGPNSSNFTAASASVRLITKKFVMFVLIIVFILLRDSLSVPYAHAKWISIILIMLEKKFKIKFWTYLLVNFLSTSDSNIHTTWIFKSLFYGILSKYILSLQAQYVDIATNKLCIVTPFLYLYNISNKQIKELIKNFAFSKKLTQHINWKYR